MSSREDASGFNCLSSSQGKLSDVYGRKAVLLLCFIGPAIGYLTMGLSGSLLIVILSRIPSGACVCLCAGLLLRSVYVVFVCAYIYVCLCMSYSTLNSCVCVCVRVSSYTVHV